MARDRTGASYTQRQTHWPPQQQLSHDLVAHEDDFVTLYHSSCQLQYSGYWLSDSRWQKHHL